MPSINEVWEQALLINANLAIVHNDLLALNACCTAMGAKADTIIQRQDQTLTVLGDTHTTLQQGFKSVLQSLGQIQQNQAVQSQLLLHQTKQNETMICALEAISRNTCTLVNLATADAPKQSRIAQASDDLVHLTQSAHPDAALDLSRHREHEQVLARCCGPRERPDPPCAYEPCDNPGPFELPDRPTKPSAKTRSRSKKS